MPRKYSRRTPSLANVHPEITLAERCVVIFGSQSGSAPQRAAASPGKLTLYL